MNVALSVILPVYNGAKYLPEAINSILNQTINDFELIIADDGSTDGSRQVIESYRCKDKRILVSNNEKNLGKVNTVNRVLALCRGKYLTIHDADDFSLLHRFDRQMTLLEKENYSLCGTAYYTFDQKGNYLNNVYPPSDYEEIRMKARKHSCFHGPTMIFRRDIIEKVGGLYRMKKMGEDVDFSMRVTEKYHTTNLTEPLYAYRLNAEAVTKSLNYDLLGRQVDHEIKYFMVKQRLNHPEGKDCMMETDTATLNAKINEITQNFYKNEEKHIRYRLGYLLSIYMYKNAFLASLGYLYRKKNIGQLKEFLYVTRECIMGFIGYSIRSKINIYHKIAQDQR